MSLEYSFKDVKELVDLVNAEKIEYLKVGNIEIKKHHSPFGGLPAPFESKKMTPEEAQKMEEEILFHSAV